MQKASQTRENKQDWPQKIKSATEGQKKKTTQNLCYSWTCACWNRVSAPHVGHLIRPEKPGSELKKKTTKRAFKNNTIQTPELPCILTSLLDWVIWLTAPYPLNGWRIKKWLQGIIYWSPREDRVHKIKLVQHDNVEQQRLRGSCIAHTVLYRKLTESAFNSMYILKELKVIRISKQE